MKRKIDIIKNQEYLNVWVKQSLSLFRNTAYLDAIQKIYNFQSSENKHINAKTRRAIIKAHNSRKTRKLLQLLKQQTKFPYEDPVWYVLNNVKGCLGNNPKQIKRIAKILYSMTAEESLVRIEAPPKLNTQTGPMFRNWLPKNFKFIEQKKFLSSKNGIVMLKSSEEEGKSFVENILKQTVHKRPDLICKANKQYIIGEAKWIGQPGGNQEKQVTEVLEFCKKQRGNVKRIGIVDGFPWAVYNENDNIINDKVAVLIQETEYDVFTALLLKKYLNQF